MTVSATIPYVAYAGAGTSGPFAIPFRFLANADLAITKTDGDGVETVLTGNTITGAGDDDGGELNTATVVAVGETLRIYRATMRAQTAQYVANGPFPAATHERALDKAMLVDQEQDRDIFRSVMVPMGDEPVRLPRAVQRAGKVLAFDMDGRPYMLGIEYPPPPPTLPEINALDYGVKGDGVTDDSVRLMELLASGKAVRLPYTAGGYNLVNVVIPSNGQLIGDPRKTKVNHLDGGPLWKPRGSNWIVEGISSYHADADDPRVFEIDTPSVRREWRIRNMDTRDAGTFLDVLTGPSAVEMYMIDDVVAYRQRGRFLSIRRHFAAGWIGYEGKVIVSYTGSADPNHEVVFVDGAIDLGGAGGMILGEIDIQGSASFPESATTPNQNGFHFRNTSGVYVGRVVADGVTGDGWRWENCSYLFGSPETSISGGDGMAFYGDCAYVQFAGVKMIGRNGAASFKPAGKHAVNVTAGATLRHAYIGGQMDDFTGGVVKGDGALRGVVLDPAMRTARELGSDLLTNGARQVWQRGLSRALSSAQTYACDCAVAQVGTGSTGTAAQVQFSAGDGLNGVTHVYRYSQNGTASTDATLWAERIEGLGRAEGGVITLIDSVRLVSGAAATLTPYVLQNFGSGGSANVTTFGAPITVSTSDFVDPVRELTVPSTAGKTIAAGAYTEVGWLLSAGADKVVDLIACQVVDGVGVPRLNLRPLAQVFHDCQRFYRTSIPYGTTPAQNAGVAGAVAWAQATAAAGHNIAPIRFESGMRTTPTITLLNPSAANAQVRNVDAGADCTNSQPLTGVSAPSGFAIYTEASGGSSAGNVLLAHYIADASL